MTYFLDFPFNQIRIFTHSETLHKVKSTLLDGGLFLFESSQLIELCFFCFDHEDSQTIESFETVFAFMLLIITLN